jgi:hypothetical protein
MSKWALYTRYANENRSYVMSTEQNSKAEARAYFMGVKQLTAKQFDQIYQVDLMQESKDNDINKGLLFG